MSLNATTALQQAGRASRGDHRATGDLFRSIIAAIGTLSDTELGFIDGITAGTGAVSKALVLDSSGNVTMPSNGQFQRTRGTLAAAGSSASDAAVIVKQISLVTGADGTVGVALPACSATEERVVVNTSASARLAVYPVNGGNDNINSLAEDAAFYVGPGRTAVFFGVSATLWYVEERATSVRQISIPICGNAKVGATAGWVITAGTNIAHATLPASQTGSTLVIPISGLAVGDMVTSVAVAGQVESAGNTASFTVDIRKLTNAAADNTDASIGTDNTNSFTADTILSAANVNVPSLTEVLATDESLYALITATTAASTDIDLTHLLVTVLSAAA